MKANFSLKKISNIVLNVRRYGKVFITTDGGAYLTESDAESAVRTKNMIIGEPNDFIGYVELKKEMLTDDKLKEIAKDVSKFNDLFADPKIPRQRKSEQKQGRKYEDAKPHDASEVASVESLLGIAAKPAEEEQKPAEEKKTRRF